MTRVFTAVKARVGRGLGLAPGSDATSPLVPLALGGLAVAFVLAFLVCVAIRLTFGFELAWLESGMQAMIDQLAAHRSMYVEPSPAYVPFLYPPLYYVVAHALGRALPSLDRFAAMRLVSTASVLATAAVIFATLRRRSGATARLSLLLTALYFAFFGRFDFWHDTSRVDSLFVALLFAAAAALFDGDGLPSAAVAGALAGLAVLTKQPAVPLFAAAAAVSVLHAAPACRRAQLGRAVLALVAATAVVMLGLAALGELRNPWFYFYVLQVPASHALLPRTLGSSALYLIGVMPVFVFAAAATLRPAGAAVSAQRLGRSRTWAAAFAAWVAITFALRLKQGTSVNFFLPVVPVGLVVLGDVVATWRARGEALLLLQFVVLLYNPLRAIPVAADWRAGFSLVGALREVRGDVFLPQFPAYLTMAGKPSVAHGIAVCDVASLRPDLLRTIQAQIEGGHYAAAIPWPDDGASTASGQRCPQGGLPSSFHLRSPIPEGGRFFAAQQADKLAGMYAFRPVPMASTETRPQADEAVRLP